MAAGDGAPIFILSFRHRDELAALAERGGWQAIAARRAEGAEARFLASGSGVLVVDARGADAEGLGAVEATSAAARAASAALLVLVSRTSLDLLPRALAAGATHFLASPFTEAEFLHALSFAACLRERVEDGGTRAGGDPRTELAWRWAPGASEITLSPALARRLGGGRETLPIRALKGVLSAADLRTARTAVRRLAQTGAATAFAHAAGEGRTVHHVRMDGIVVAARVEPIGEAAVAAGKDPLTRTVDAASARRWVTERLGAREPGRRPAVVLLVAGVSRLDMINAAFGRPVGDALLQALARRIERVMADVAHPCVLARIGGTQFLVALGVPAGVADGRRLAARLVEALDRPFVEGDHVIPIASRIGIAIDEGNDDAEALIRRARAAAAGTGEGDGPVRLLHAQDEHAISRDTRLEVDLRRALDADEIEILFQPQVAIVTGRIVGVEALARWRHADLGELGAQALFAAAQRSHYLQQLSEHVQRKAVALAAGWPAELSALTVAVNITAADISRPGFLDRILGLIDSAGLDRRRITLEITEGNLIEDLAAASNLLARLRAAGVRVAVDDFGTGYSSIAYLKALPLDYLKLDAALAQDIGGSARDRLVVRSVIDLGRSLGLGVVAEGVEDERQLALLAEAGCNLYQGFLCAPPLTGEALAALVRERDAPALSLAAAPGSAPRKPSRRSPRPR